MRRRRLVPLLIAVLALVAVGCGDDDDGVASQPGDDSSATTAAAEDDTTDTTDDGGESTAGATVQVAENSEFGELLVGPNGHTLYLFERDQGTQTACTGGCLANWPPLVSQGDPTAGEGVDQSKLTVVNNGQIPNHVAYNGKLLYFFAQDQQPGDVKGATVPAWFPVDPEGNKIERS